jgi:arylsulfatase A-like enzyme
MTPAPCAQVRRPRAHGAAASGTRRRSGAPALALISALLLAAAGCEPAPPEDTSPKGIVLVVVDTLRSDHLGCYGDPRGLTPELDELAAESVVFANTVAASSWTRSSMAAMFTSRYPSEIGMLKREDVVPDPVVTLAEALQEGGVQTLGVSTNMNAGTRFGFAQGFDLFVEKLPKVSYPDDPMRVPAEAVTKRAARVLDERDPERPFLLYVHYIDPHSPYFEHPGLLDEPEPPGRFGGSERDLAVLDAQKPEEHRPEDLDRIRWLYAGEVKYCDLWLGELFDELRARGLWDDVLVMVTSDHGEGLWDHGERDHGTDLYEEQIDVPLLVKFPVGDGIAPTVTDAIVGHVDLAPTLLTTLGLPVPGEYRGADLRAAVRAGRGDGRFNHGYSEMRRGIRDLESIEDGRTKFIRNRGYDRKGDASGRVHTVRPGDTLNSLSERYLANRGQYRWLLRDNPQLGIPVESPLDTPLPVGATLTIPDRIPNAVDPVAWRFDLVGDPGETSNLAEGPLSTDDVLVKLMQRIADENLARAIASDSVDMSDLDPELLEELRGLGYVGN